MKTKQLSVSVCNAQELKQSDTDVTVLSAHSSVTFKCRGLLVKDSWLPLASEEKDPARML